MRISVASCSLPRRVAFFAAVVALVSGLPNLLRAVDPVPAEGTPPSQGDTSPAIPVPGIENSVVKVFSTASYPDLYKPWAKQAPVDLTGSGVVIEGKRILTNAHVVLYANQVQIQANQSGDKISATVEAIAPGIDLAVLKLDDEQFFDTHAPLPRAKDIPNIKDTVMVYGYPKGGDSLSITKGIVSRIEFKPYRHFVHGLRIQIDASINPGNSGGPAVAGDKMIGLAFSHLSDAQNIGYIIPCEEIELFLQDIAKGPYHGKPAIYDNFQTLENPALRSYLKLAPDVHGIVVSRPFSDDPAYPLKQNDVITKIGDTPIDDQGMIKLTGNLRVDFAFQVQKIARDGKVPLAIVRDGKEIALDLPVSPTRPSIIPDLEGAPPSYFVYGPLVFSDATSDYVTGFMRSTSGATAVAGFIYDRSPLIRRLGDRPAFEGERLVLVSSPFFPSKLTNGYGNPMAEILKAVNGKPVKNLAHLVEMLRDCKDEFVRLEFDNQRAEMLVFRRADVLSATDGILGDNGIRNLGSADILSVWNAKPSSP